MHEAWHVRLVTAQARASLIHFSPLWSCSDKELLQHTSMFGNLCHQLISRSILLPLRRSSTLFVLGSAACVAHLIMRAIGSNHLFCSSSSFYVAPLNTWSSGSLENILSLHFFILRHIENTIIRYNTSFGYTMILIINLNHPFNYELSVK